MKILLPPNAAALLWLFLTATPASGWTGSSRSCGKTTPRTSSIALFVSSSSNSPVVSDRLSKARLLLQELSSNEALPASPSSSGSSKTGTITVLDELDNMMIVPDTYWRNGHLQGGTSVTRWSAGVKVAEPVVQYDPVATEKLLFRQPAKWVVRNFQIAVPFGWWAFGVVTDYVTGQSENRRQRARQLTTAISSLGPAIIKGGQALSSRADLLPLEYLEELQKLQDDVPRFSNQIAFQVAKEELELDNFSDMFELVQDEPVAAASIGQVYKARLKTTGDVVALKIQRPGCEEIIALDLYVLRWWSGVYNRIFQILKRNIDLQSVIDDFGELIYREIDYIAEMANAQRFNELYAGVRDVFVPKVYSELTTSKVLTMEWVEGVRLTDKASLRKFGLEESRMVDTLVQCSLKQILENGFFHADPHAGNMLACPDGRLCYLDFGMMSYANQDQRNGFLLAIVHIVNRDWSALVRLYVGLGFIPEGTDLKPIEVALERALPDVLNADVTELNFKTVINKLGDVMYTYPFSLPPFYIAIIRCLGVLEGLAMQVDPTARIISDAYPYIASRVLTDPQEQLQEALRRLALTNDGRIRWDRLEALLDEAKDSSGYDVAAALNVLSDYLVAEDSDPLLKELSDQIVDAADSLGAESLQYLFEASRAVAANDEVGAFNAFRSLQQLLDRRDRAADENSQITRLRARLPEPTPAMKRFGKIVTLLSGVGGSASAEPSKFMPIVRKLSQDDRIRRTANEILARLGDRILSRSLRSVFGLPPPLFGRENDSLTVTESNG